MPSNSFPWKNGQVHERVSVEEWVRFTSPPFNKTPGIFWMPSDVLSCYPLLNSVGFSICCGPGYQHSVQFEFCLFGGNGQGKAPLAEQRALCPFQERLIVIIQLVDLL